ncbi:MAG: histidine kinase dimerization/phospho-acceptor domain-containing protein, partial [bacterium]
MALTEVIDSGISNYVLQVNRPLNQNELRNQFQRILSQYSGPRILVWLNQNNQPPLFPSTSTFFSIAETSGSKPTSQLKQSLLMAAGTISSGIQKPRLFTHQGITYFTCSMPLNSGYGTLGFLEDVGVSPSSSSNNILLLFGIWIALVLVTTFFIQSIFSYALLPIARLERAIGSIMLRPSGEVDRESIPVAAQPHELKGIAIAYAQLSSRLQGSWTRQNLFVKSISHELLTPLTVITSSSKRLLNKLKGIEPNDRNLLSSTYRESSRVTSLVRDLLDLARSDTGSLTISREKFDICHEIACLEKDISDLPWGHRVNFNFQEQLNLPRELFAIGDAQRFR